MSDYVIEVEDLYFDHLDLSLLSGISFKVRRGEVVALIGRSGSGKTTLFRLLAGLAVPLKGRVIVCEDVSYMTQVSLLMPWRTVLGNLTLLQELGVCAGMNPAHFEERARLVLLDVGLEGYEDFYPKEISGGMQSRVSLARALLEDRPILLLDEPFAFLDAITRVEMQQLLMRLQSKYHKTILLVTHEINEAIHLAHTILLLAQGKMEHRWTVAAQDRVTQSHLTEKIMEQLCPELCLRQVVSESLRR